MTAAPPSNGRMDWHGTNGPPPHPYHTQSYDAYNPPPPSRGPPLTPGSYHTRGSYSPHRTGPSPRIHPPKYWHEQQQQQPPHRRPPQSYGPPPTSYDGGHPYSGDGRQGPPPHPGYPYDYYNPRRDVYPHTHPSHPPPPPPHYRTPPPHLRRTDSESASVSHSASFSSKEDHPEVERAEPPKSGDWEPTRSTKQEKGNKQDDSLSLLAKVAMEPIRSNQSSKDAAKEGNASIESEKNDGITVTSPSKDESEEPRHTILRSSPIVAPSSVVVPPPSSIKQPPPPVYRETSYPPPSASITTTVTPKPITPTGMTHYGQPPSSATPASHPPHRPINPPYGAYEDRGPYPPPYGMTPPHGSAPGSVNYGPPPPGTYPSGYDSRSGSWEQPYVPPNMASPAVVEERNSFDSYESSGNSRGSSHYYPYHHDYGRDPRGYPAPYPPSHGSWQQPPPDPRSGGYPYPGWGSAGYEPPPPHHGYPPPPSHHHMTPPRIMGGPPPPTPPYYDERSSYPHHIQPSPYGGVPMNRPPYPYMQPPNRDEKTVLRKKFSWKHFPELERFLIENRDDYLKFSSRNYTVEQKQFNNTLTERLIMLAEKNGYVFDPEEFNFVAIRDRIRCYYKSYVQTARKRGLMLPTDKTPSALSTSALTTHESDAMDDGDDHDEENNEEEEEEGIEVDENGVTLSSPRSPDAAPDAHGGDEEKREI